MIVLDTHILIWWVNSPQKLSKKAKKAIDEEKSKNGILISSISTLEIYLLIRKGKLELTNYPDAWLERIESLPYVHFVPMDNQIAVSSVKLPDFTHKDPADRIIIATALNIGAQLVTSDKKILDYSKVQTIW